MLVKSRRYADTAWIRLYSFRLVLDSTQPDLEYAKQYTAGFHDHTFTSTGNQTYGPFFDQSDPVVCIAADSATVQDWSRTVQGIPGMCITRSAGCSVRAS